MSLSVRSSLNFRPPRALCKYLPACHGCAGESCHRSVPARRVPELRARNQEPGRTSDSTDVTLPPTHLRTKKYLRHPKPKKWEWKPSTGTNSGTKRFWPTKPLACNVTLPPSSPATKELALPPSTNSQAHIPDKAITVRECGTTPGPAVAPQMRWGTSSV